MLVLLALESPSEIAASIKRLESALESGSQRLAIATALVVLGLLIEYFDDVLEVIVAAVRSARFGRFSDLRSLERKVVITVVGGVFVTAGVAAELRYEYKIGILESGLEAENGKLIAFLNEKASAADERSEILKKATEDERFKRVQLQHSMEWRHLSRGAVNALCRILPPQTQAAETVVLTVWSDPEPALYAGEFRKAIGSCRPLPGNPDIKEGPALALSSWTFPLKLGVSLEFPAHDAHLANTLATALRANGVGVTIPPTKARENPKSENRFILVGPRPSPQEASRIARRPHPAP